MAERYFTGDFWRTGGLLSFSTARLLEGHSSNVAAAVDRNTKVEWEDNDSMSRARWSCTTKTCALKWSHDIECSCARHQ